MHAVPLTKTPHARSVTADEMFDRNISYYSYWCQYKFRTARSNFLYVLLRLWSRGWPQGQCSVNRWIWRAVAIAQRLSRDRRSEWRHHGAGRRKHASPGGDNRSGWIFESRRHPGHRDPV